MHIRVDLSRMSQSDGISTSGSSSRRSSTAPAPPWPRHRLKRRDSPQYLACESTRVNISDYVPANKDGKTGISAPTLFRSAVLETHPLAERWEYLARYILPRYIRSAVARGRLLLTFDFACSGFMV